MIRSLLLGSALIGLISGDPTAEDVANYEAAKTEAGRDADAHVRLALYAELRGFADFRLEQLQQAVEIKPDHPIARRLLGQVLVDGEWITPSKAIERAKARADRADKLARYELRREPIADTPRAHWQLATWCEQEGLEAEAKTHLRAVVRLDPSREDAWKKLGAHKQAGHWVLPDRQAADKLDADARRKAETKWRPLLAKWKTWLTQPSHKAEAEAAIETVTDPGASASIVKVFGSGNSDDQATAVRLLSQIDSPSATRALAWLAVFGANDAIRVPAAKGLAGRDPRECSAWLVSLLRNPIKFEVKPVGGPGSPGELYVEGKKLNTRNFYDAPTSVFDYRPGDTLAFDENGYLVARRTVGFSNMPLAAAVDPLYLGTSDMTGWGPRLAQAGLGAEGNLIGKQLEQNQKNNQKVASSLTSAGAGALGGYRSPIQAEIPVEQMARQAEQQAALARQKLQSDVANLERFNADVNDLNARVVSALKSISGESREANFDAWRKWWVELEETSTIAPPRTRPGDLDAPKLEANPLGSKAHLPAFAKGTTVWTELGLRPIDDVRAGDLVLTQDPVSNSLGFTPVWSIRRIDPGLARTIRFANATVEATDLERFWVAGRGWVMLADLQKGDRVRTLDGLATIEAIEAPKPLPAFHVQVGDGRGLFVGESGMMAHDDLVNNPVATPFDSPTTQRSTRPD